MSQRYFILDEFQPVIPGNPRVYACVHGIDVINTHKYTHTHTHIYTRPYGPLFSKVTVTSVVRESKYRAPRGIGSIRMDSMETAFPVHIRFSIRGRYYARLIRNLPTVETTLRFRHSFYGDKGSRTFWFPFQPRFKRYHLASVPIHISNISRLLYFNNARNGIESVPVKRCDPFFFSFFLFRKIYREMYTGLNETRFPSFS